jgi:hypothetical protein
MKKLLNTLLEHEGTVPGGQDAIKKKGVSQVG